MGKIYSAFEKKRSEERGLITDLETEYVSEEPKNDFYVSNSDISMAEPYEEIPENIDPTLVTVHIPHSIESEQFRLLKNNILFPENGTPPRSIMITSPSPDEGKSFVAANLSISIAQSIDEHVLLMDCDLRSPTIHKLFGLPDTKGLSDHLSTAITLSSLLLKTFINKLTILPGGTVPRNPSELLSSEHMRRLIHEVKLRYSDRYIIIDTPPPYITSEGNALARYVDGIIVIIRHGKTRMKDVQDIISIYGKEKIIGVVHNFAEKRPGYGYGYYKYGYGNHKYGHVK
ncbi:polysaccharide biosynthesis tyrosine autokinase [Desulfobacula toluolica]|uniref:Exopolysaccharide synthesis protein, capsular exopolysaccharide family n=1 Tax=Desulfobacula toluolica (strain DSM 7467 / Tol2) TaxID=651182 RepID=K0NP00_DESTT|nr:polysaccharide biosynthesis tyrosine autokinase [Desulfobacula toluolica]CCK80497.1 exopolysaccharide synthesis protein, capsular exopolysaccharide family [Desulfobacula toluolica Tol2]